MARQKTFEPDEALDKAMRLFWRRGYHATSIQDLVEATGLNRASLYDTFGGKEDLFLAAVERYLAQVNRARLAKLRANPSPKSALTGYFEDLIAFDTGEGRHLGCLLTNSAIEFGERGEGIGQRLYGLFDEVEETLVGLIEKAQALGEVSPAKDPRAAARFLLTMINGMRVMSRVKSDDAAWMRDAASGLSWLFGEPPRGSKAV